MVEWEETSASEPEDNGLDGDIGGLLRRLADVSVQDVISPAGEEEDMEEALTPPGTPLGGFNQLILA